MSTDPFVAGSVAALEIFLAELRANRGRVENETEPAFDVICDLLEQTIAPLRSLMDGARQST